MAFMDSLVSFLFIFLTDYSNIYLYIFVNNSLWVLPFKDAALSQTANTKEHGM